MPTLERTKEGIALSVAQLRERIEMRRQEDWEPEPGKSARARKYHWERVAERYAQKLKSGEYFGDELLPQLRHEKAMILLGREFIRAAESGNARIVRGFIEEGFPANYQDPLTGETALHAGAGTRARDVLRALLASGRCDFLLRDKRERLASELAYLYGNDPAAAHLLRIKERKQAQAQGIALTRRPHTSP